MRQEKIVARVSKCPIRWRQAIDVGADRSNAACSGMEFPITAERLMTPTATYAAGVFSFAPSPRLMPEAGTNVSGGFTSIAAGHPIYAKRRCRR